MAELTKPCVLFPGSLEKDGYGIINNKGTKRRAHRVAWEEANGPIPPGMCVLHHCDNRACIEVEHLFLGTRAQNTADMMSKGRQSRGTRNGSAKLTEADVIAIRAATGRQRSLAEKYGVMPSVICQIKSRKAWKHL